MHFTGRTEFNMKLTFFLSTTGKHTKANPLKHQGSAFFGNLLKVFFLSFCINISSKQVFDRLT